MTHPARWYTAIFALVVLAVSHAQGEEWIPETLERYDIWNNPRAVDFSRAGYISPAEGEPHPWERAVRELGPAPTDDSTATIQSAVDELGEAGGGTVKLGPGTWNISAVGIKVPHDNIRIEGAGRDKTTIHMAATSTARQSAFHLGKTHPGTHIGSHGYRDSWVRQEVVEDSEMLAQDVVANQYKVYVDRPSRRPGELVIITSGATEDFIADHGMQEDWQTRMDAPTYLRRIESVEPDGYILDLPVRYRLLARDRARVFPATRLVKNLSLADFTLTYELNPNDNFDDGAGARETSSSTTIRVTNVYNGVIERIEMPMIHSRGVELAYSSHMTVRDVRIMGAQNRNATWNGYLFFVWGSDNLFERTVARGGRRNYTVLMAMAHGNVFHNCVGLEADFPSDFHMHLSHENLIDVFTGHGDSWSAHYRPFGVPIRHGISGTENVFWNIRTDQQQSVWSSQFGLGYVIGTIGGVNTDGMAGRGLLPIDIVEGVDRANEMRPFSLYLYQTRGEMGMGDLSEYWRIYE